MAEAGTSAALDEGAQAQVTPQITSACWVCSRVIISAARGLESYSERTAI